MLQKLKHTKGVPELFFAGKEKELFLVMEYISSIIAVSARDSILMKNSNSYRSTLFCYFINIENASYALKNKADSIMIKGEHD